MNRWCKFFDMTAEPLNHPHVRYVNSIAELVSTPMCAEVNALCLRRSLDGDFAEVIRHLRAERGITTLDRDQLLALRVSDAGKIAIEAMLRDQEELRALMQEHRVLVFAMRMSSCAHKCLPCVRDYSQILGERMMRAFSII